MRRQPATRILGVSVAALVLALTQALAYGAAGQDWPMFGHDARHTGVSAETGIGASNAAALAVEWQANTGAASYTSPVVVTDAASRRTLVYQGSQNGAMSAYDADTGARAWVFKIPSQIQSSPSVVDGVLYFGASDHHFYALDAGTGSLICKADVGGVIAASPVVVDPDGTGLVAYFGDNGLTGSDDGGHVLAYNAVDGNAAANCSRKWAFAGFGVPAGSSPLTGSWSPPAFATDRNGRPLIVVGSSSPDCAVYALDARTGQQVWRFQTQIFSQDSDVGAGPTISPPGVNGFADGVAYVAGKNKVVHALNLRTGALIWRFGIGADAPGSGGATRSTAALLGNRLFLGFGKGTYGLDATTGAKVWRSDTGTEVISSPAVTGPPGEEVLFVGDLGGTVRALRAVDGRQLWSNPTGAFIYSSAAVSDGRVYIASSSGFLFAFSLAGTSSGAPDTRIDHPANGSVIPHPGGALSLTGSASDDKGVVDVLVGVKNRSTSKWWDGATGTWVALFTPNRATLGPSSGTSRNWSYAWPAPVGGGDFMVQAEAVDSDGQHDTVVPTAAFTVTGLNNPPDTTITSPVFKQVFNFPGGVRQEFDIQLAGQATDVAGARPGVTRVYVTVKNREHGEWYCGTCAVRWQPTAFRNVATLTSAGSTTTSWRLVMRAYDHPHSYYVTAWAVDRDGNEDATRAVLQRFCVRDPGDISCA
jgi:outer membrane protein assembly factor BamB